MVSLRPIFDSYMAVSACWSTSAAVVWVVESAMLTPIEAVTITSPDGRSKGSKRRAEPFAHAACRLDIDVGREHDELVTGDPRHEIAVADGVDDSSGDGNEQLVAGLVSHDVVDVLEPVEIDEQQRNVGRGVVRQSTLDLLDQE